MTLIKFLMQMDEALAAVIQLYANQFTSQIDTHMKLLLLEKYNCAGKPYHTMWSLRSQ